MGDAHRRESERRPVALQIRLAFADVGEFVDRYATNIGDGGIFIRSRDPRPVGTRLSFELRLRGGEIAFAGEGLVRWVQTLDAKGLGTPGMGIQFDQLTDESRAVLEQILKSRDEGSPGPIDGADPTRWRPLDEFPTPVTEFEPVETQPPPVLERGPIPAVAESPASAALTPALLAPTLLGVRRDLVERTDPFPPTMQPAPRPIPVRAPAESTDPMLARVRLTRAEPAPALSVVERVRTPAAVGLELGWSSLRVALADGDAARGVSFGGASDLAAVVGSDGKTPVFGTKASSTGRAVRGLASLLGVGASSRAAAIWERRELGEVVAGASGPAVKLGGEGHEAKALVEGLLRESAAEVSRTLARPIGRVVVAVPAGLSEARRHAFEEAARRAGLPIERIAPVPALAVLGAFGVRGRRRVLVASFEDGYFEASVVEQSANVVEVVSTVHEADIGALEVDLALVGALFTQFEEETGYLVPEDFEVFDRVRQAATRARIELSDALDVEVRVPDIVEAGLSKAELRQRVARARLVGLAQPVVDRALEAVRTALAARTLGPADLDAVLLVGEMARFPSFALRMQERFGKDAIRVAQGHPAAEGAALLAGGADNVGHYLVNGCVGQTLWVAADGAPPRRVIERGLSLPAERVYTAVAGENQLSTSLGLFQGESAQMAENEAIGVLQIGPLPTPPWGERARAAVTLRFDDRGALVVKARPVGHDGEAPLVLDRTRVQGA